jgi:transcription antitermination protein NusB
MGARTGGREAALQMLYALDSRRVEDGADSADIELLINDFWREVPGDPEGRDFADMLVRGVFAELATVDEQISSASKHWRIERMSRVDRNVLRLGVHELAKHDEVPRAVIIDEAVELAKRFGAEGSSVFVNGVLDRIAEDLARS